MEKLIIGTYTRRDSKGIMQFDVNRELKKAQAHLLDEVVAATYMIRHDGSLYSVFKDDNGAGIKIYTELENSLELVQTVYSGEHSSSCHITYHPTLPRIATTNYGEGSLQIYDQEKGEWSLSKRIVSKAGSHQHFAYFTRDGMYLIVCDLGLNQLITYDMSLEVVSSHLFSSKEGPRHFVTNHDESILYVLCELSNNLKVLRRTGHRLEETQSLSILADLTVVGNNAGAIRMTSDGKYIYVSSRNQEETICAFVVKSDGNIEFVQRVLSGGLHPRDINLSSDEKYLIVANKDSDNLVYFKRGLDGTLTYEFEIAVKEPVCIVV